MRSARPWGITVLAILTALAGAGGVVYGLLPLALGSPYLDSDYLYMAIPILAFAAWGLFFAWAMWHLRPWVWTLLVMGSVSGIVMAIFAGSMSGWSIVEVVGLAFDGLVTYYLFLPEVKGAFRAG